MKHLTGTVLFTQNGNKATSLPSNGSSERVFPEKVQKQSKGYGFIILAKSKSE